MCDARTDGNHNPFWCMRGDAPEVSTATFIARMLDPNCTASALSISALQWLLGFSHMVNELKQAVD